jgi:hypothetical protein
MAANRPFVTMLFFSTIPPSNHIMRIKTNLKSYNEDKDLPHGLCSLSQPMGRPIWSVGCDRVQSALTVFFIPQVTIK